MPRQGKKETIISLYDDFVSGKYNYKQVAVLSGATYNYVQKVIGSHTRLLQIEARDRRKAQAKILNSKQMESEVKDFDLKESLKTVTMTSRVRELPNNKVEHIFQSTMN